LDKRADSRKSRCASDERLASSLLVTEALISGLVAGYGVAIPVGTIGLLILGLSARTSLRVGAGAALGVAAADGIYALVAVLGGSRGRLATALVSSLLIVAPALRTAASV
jgi:hypothetical protein